MAAALLCAEGGGDAVWRCEGLPGHAAVESDCAGPGPFAGIDPLERRRRRGCPARDLSRETWFIVVREPCFVWDAPSRGARLVAALRRGAAVSCDAEREVGKRRWARVASGDARHWFYGCWHKRELSYTGAAWLCADLGLGFGFGAVGNLGEVARRGAPDEARALDGSRALGLHPQIRCHAADLLPFAPRGEDTGDRFGFSPFKPDWRRHLAEEVLGWAHVGSRAYYGADGEAPSEAPAPRRSWSAAGVA